MRSHSFYEQKCVEHLSRVMVSHNCALRAANDVEKQDDLESLLSLADAKEGELKSLINDIHFVALKTNFELFLQLSLRQVWLEHFDHLVIKQKMEIQLVELVGIQSEEDVKLFIIEKLVPSHGLQPILEAINDLTKIRLNKLSSKVKELWNQISATFAIRHLIEHRNGRVDRKFQSELKYAWSKTSFGRSNMPSIGQRVDVTAEDVDASYQAMSATTPVICGKLQEWRPQNVES